MASGEFAWRGLDTGSPRSKDGSVLEVRKVPGGKLKLLTALAVGAALAISGCGTPSGGEGSSATPTMAAEAPTKYNPCTDIPREILDSEMLEDSFPDDFSAGGVKWKGCLWAQSDGDGYSVSIQTTNLTVAMVRDKNFPGSVESVVDGRKVITSQQAETDIEEDCTVNVEIDGGSVQFSLTNSGSAKRTGHLNTCDLTKLLAEKVIPSIPDDV